MSKWGVVVSCVLAACGGGGGGGGDDMPAIDAAVDAPVGAATIGPEGGAIASSDGIVVLTVPAGALTAATELTIDVVPQSAWPANIVDANPVGAVYAIGPEGTAFATPATLTWTFATAPASTKGAGGEPRFLFGYARSAAGTIEPHERTSSTPGTGGSLVVVSTIAHLSEHVLSINRVGANGWGPPVGTFSIDLKEGRHALHVPWSAATFEMVPSSLEPGANIGGELFVEAPVDDVSESPWMAGTYGEQVTLNPSVPWRPAPMPRFECTAIGMTTIRAEAGVALQVGTRYLSGIVNELAEIECYEREQKPEYTAETTALGTARLAPLAVPATGTTDLATSAGAYGYLVDIPPGATVRFCVSASMAASVNYYPQYPPGFNFVDGQPGCTDITNIDADNPNQVLVKVAGGGSPNNITVTTSVP